MEEIRYVALLRGINVGGKNIIKMDDLKQSFEDMNFTNIKTYIQSGNILFGSKEKNKIKLTAEIEKTLSEKYNYEARAVILSFNELKEIISEAPEDFGKEKEKYRYDVWFLKAPLTAEEVINSVRIKEGVDKIYKGNNVVYTSRLTSEATKSRLIKIIQLLTYRNMTIRNWNTTTKIYEIGQPT
jgi:uncharacterized protein (DUF1697 family)